MRVFLALALILLAACRGPNDPHVDQFVMPGQERVLTSLLNGADAEALKDLVVFGDSLSDIGRLHRRSLGLYIPPDKASTRIVQENKVIVVGNLSAKKLAKTKMAKSIHDAATTMFRTMLKYKASARRRWYVEVDEANTTRTCSGCLAIPASAPRGVKGLSIREWVCCECGAIHDRDINAALNILRIGRDALASEVS